MPKTQPPLLRHRQRRSRISDLNPRFHAVEMDRFGVCQQVPRRPGQSDGLPISLAIPDRRQTRRPGLEIWK